MTLTMDVSRNLPTGMEIFDGFDVDEIDEERWTKKENGSTTVKQASGELIFENLGEGSKGITYYESVNKYGKNWRITTDIKLEQAIPSNGNGFWNNLIRHREAMFLFSLPIHPKNLAISWNMNCLRKCCQTISGIPEKMCGFSIEMQKIPAIWKEASNTSHRQALMFRTLDLTTLKSASICWSQSWGPKFTSSLNQ